MHAGRDAVRGGGDAATAVQGGRVGLWSGSDAVPLATRGEAALCWLGVPSLPVRWLRARCTKRTEPPEFCIMPFRASDVIVDRIVDGRIIYE